MTRRKFNRCIRHSLPRNQGEILSQVCTLLLDAHSTQATYKSKATNVPEPSAKPICPSSKINI